MYAVKFTEGPERTREGRLDISFRRCESWDAFGYPGVDGAKLRILLFGDAQAGPMIFLSALPPVDGAIDRGPAHGHDSDNWRISILGASTMGPERYAEGEFRFQHGGVPYGADDLASGPEGGFGFVMMADRRGFPVRPVKPDPRVDEVMAATAHYAGVTVADPYLFGPAIATQIGAFDKAGKVEGSFADASAWPLVAGVHTSVAILGDRVAGPVLMLIRADGGATAAPDLEIDTEIVHTVVAGSCSNNEEMLERGDIRLHEAGSRTGAVVAGADGLSLVTVIGDRRALLRGESRGVGTSASWLDDVRTTVTTLLAGLGPEAGPRRRRAVPA